MVHFSSPALERTSHLLRLRARRQLSRTPIDLPIDNPLPEDVTLLAKKQKIPQNVAASLTFFINILDCVERAS